MPRPPKKADDKAKVPIPTMPIGPPPMMPAPAPAGVMPPPPGPMTMGPPMPARVIDTESFLRVRDSAVGRLSTIVDLLRSFTQDYIRQTNLLLGESAGDNAGMDLLASFDNAAASLMMPVPDMAPPVEEKKERKKRTHDPNAPKRPLTPYFLYMQHARSIIANDLGTEAPKGAVQEEGQRRWAHMGPMEKQGWNNAYQYNLRLYNARVHSYKSGNPHAKNMSDEEALKYAEDFSIPMPEMKDASANAHAAEATANDQDAIAQQLQQVAAANDAEDPTKTPKKGANAKKRKTATPAGVAPGMMMPDLLDAAKGTPASPDKKRRRTSNKGGDDKEEPKKPAARGKKAKA